MWKSEVLVAFISDHFKDDLVIRYRNTGPQHINGSELQSGHTDPSQINFSFENMFL